MSLTYAEVGATATLPLPERYHHLRHRTNLGPVNAVAATELVCTFAAHRGMPTVSVVSDVSRAAIGARVTIRAGLVLRAPCEIVAVFDEPGRGGFAYGTLAGHPECGEEAFLVLQEPGESDVWFEVRAFSRPAAWYARAGGPLVPLLQRAYAATLTRSLRRLLKH